MTLCDVHQGHESRDIIVFFGEEPGKWRADHVQLISDYVYTLFEVSDCSLRIDSVIGLPND